MGALENMQARAVEMAGPVDAAEAIPEGSVVDAPVAETITETAAAADDTTPDTPEVQAQKARLALLEEKLKKSRETRQAQRLEERARSDRKQAASERRAAADERAKYDGLKAGSFKETIQKLGHDPAKVFVEMQREAVEASDPAAIARREQEAITATIREQKERIDALERERQDSVAQARAQQRDANLQHHFTQALQDPAFRDLRIEYDDASLLEHAKYYDKNPKELHQHASTFGVTLTNPGKGFTMPELLKVLSAAQAKHNEAKQARQAALSPAQADEGRTPTVNGTAARRNAGTVTNELAQTRASSGPVETGSVRDRIRARIEQEAGKYR